MSHLPDFTPEIANVSDRITQLEEANATSEALFERVLHYRAKDAKSMTDQELIDVVACAKLHRRTTSGPPATKSASRKVEAADLFDNL